MHSRRTLICHSIINLLASRRETLSVAESCTGGLICEWLTRISGSSTVLNGAIVAYTDKIKTEFLGIDARLISSHGAVSDQVAQSMAIQACKLFKSNWALSTTGFAGPNGGSSDAPIGTVFIGLKSPTISLSMRHFYPNVPRQRVRELAALQALIWLEKEIGAAQTL